MQVEPNRKGALTAYLFLYYLNTIQGLVQNVTS